LMGSEEKDIFAKMHRLGMQVLYLPWPILHHSIPAYKLEENYFNRLTTQIGISERQRTLAVSKTEYSKRLFLEAVKWGGTLVLWLRYLICFQPQKGNKLISFRTNVSKGLLNLAQ
ncbi:MAG: glycosyltransferase family 2 protein, partial [Bacteroidales bacterium]|nr:glycosyltransferase family 2 protein [Bacteroidales bacterium]